MPENSDRVQDLHAQTRRVQTDFISADLDMALTFVGMARLETNLGEIERAEGLLSKAREAADVVSAHIHEASAQERKELKGKRKKLLDEIREAEARLHAR